MRNQSIQILDDGTMDVPPTPHNLYRKADGSVERILVPPGIDPAHHAVRSCGARPGDVLESDSHPDAAPPVPLPRTHTHDHPRLYRQGPVTYKLDPKSGVRIQRNGQIGNPDGVKFGSKESLSAWTSSKAHEALALAVESTPSPGPLMKAVLASQLVETLTWYARALRFLSRPFRWILRPIRRARWALQLDREVSAVIRETTNEIRHLNAVYEGTHPASKLPDTGLAEEYAKISAEELDLHYAAILEVRSRAKPTFASTRTPLQDVEILAKGMQEGA